jgi:hypothetical protein
MLYDRAPGRITPLRENDDEFVFAYFCDDNPKAVELSIPRSTSDGRCPACLETIHVERDRSGWFINPKNPHTAAKPRYDRVPGPVRPLRENDREYVFAYFCGDSPTAVEVTVRRSTSNAFCPVCQEIVHVERDRSGWFLDANKPHTGAKPRDDA